MRDLLIPCRRWWSLMEEGLDGSALLCCESVMKTTKINYALSGGAAYLQDEQDYNKVFRMVERDFNREMNSASIEGTQMDLRVDAVLEYEDRVFPLA